jgi:hypothetical protein
VADAVGEQTLQLAGQSEYSSCASVEKRRQVEGNDQVFEGGKNMRTLNWLVLAALLASYGQNSAPAQTAAEREAEQHFRVAKEALRHDDFNVALEELRKSAELAPRNPLVWYNIAVIESKKDDAKSAMEHLRKALDLGIPADMEGQADELMAKLTYSGRKQELSEKLEELRTLMYYGYHSPCSGDRGDFPSGGEGVSYEWSQVSKFEGCRATLSTERIDWHHILRGTFSELKTAKDYQLDLGNLMSEVLITYRDDKCTGSDGEQRYPIYVVWASPPAHKWIPGHLDSLVTSAFKGHADPDTHSSSSTVWGRIEVVFLSREQAQNAAKALSKAIEMCSAGQVQAQEVRCFEHSKGRFQAVGEMWQEYLDGQPTYRYVETLNDATFIYMVDRSRNVRLALPKAGGEAQVRVNFGPWTSGYQVRACSDSDRRQE